MKKPIFIAHRGAPLPARRENSLPAFQRAKETGRFSYIEFDVRRTRSDDEGQRVPIVAHDATTDRLYDLQRIPKYKRNFSGVELSSLTYDMLKSDSLEVATLAEVFRLLNGHPVNVEVKNLTALPEMLEVIHDFVNQTTSNWKMDDFVISSFDWQVLTKTKQLVPNMKVGILYGPKNLSRLPFSIFKKVDAEFIHINKWLAPLISPLSASFGIKNRYVFSVDSKFGVYFLGLFGVNGFTTNSISLPDKF